jgi:hypothetical protein
MYRINGYGGGRRQTIFAGLYTAIPAEAGIHDSTAPAPEKWIPAFAGMTVSVVSSQIISS